VLRLWAALALVTVVVAFGVGGTVAAFSDPTDNPSDQVSAATDYIAPDVTAGVVGKTPGYDTGYVHQNAQYYFYANVSADTGNPASGTASVTASYPGLTVPMTAGSYSVGGVSYNYRSAVQTLPNGSPEGTYDLTITATDGAGNSAGFTGPRTIDNAAPTASDVQAANGGSVAGRPEASDTITFTYNEPIDPESILAGWNGAQTDVVVRINNNTPTNDQFQIYNSANTAQLPLGSVNLARTDYVTASRTFGATGTKAKMTRSGNSITVVLGTQSGAGTTAAATGTMNWAPSTSAYDRAGNASTATAVNEGGTADKEF
jgi:hypothetical protein